MNQKMLSILGCIGIALLLSCNRSATRFDLFSVTSKGSPLNMNLTGAYLEGGATKYDQVYWVLDSTGNAHIIFPAVEGQPAVIFEGKWGTKDSLIVLDVYN